MFQQSTTSSKSTYEIYVYIKIVCRRFIDMDKETLLTLVSSILTFISIIMIFVSPFITTYINELRKKNNIKYYQDVVDTLLNISKAVINTANNYKDRSIKYLDDIDESANNIKNEYIGQEFDTFTFIMTQIEYTKANIVEQSILNYEMNTKMFIMQTLQLIDDIEIKNNILSKLCNTHDISAITEMIVDELNKSTKKLEYKLKLAKKKSKILNMLIVLAYIVIMSESIYLICIRNDIGWLLITAMLTSLINNSIQWYSNKKSK